MSNISNSASAAPLASNVAAIGDKATKEKAPRRSREITEDVSAIVLGDAVKAVKETDSANYSFATSLLAMTIDALSRKAARGELENETFTKSKEGALPSGVTKTHADVLYALQVRCVYTGLQIYLDTKEHVAEIAAMSNGGTVEKNGKRVPNETRRAKMQAARDYVESKYVNDGRMLPVTVDKAALVAGKYPGAKAKAMVSSFATARRMSAFLLKWVWENRRSFILGFEGKTLEAADVEHVRNVVRDAFGTTFAELESAYKAGRPAPQPRGSLFDRITGTDSPLRKELDKADLETITALSKFFNNYLAQRSRAVEDAELAAGLDSLGDDMAMPGFDDEDEGAMPADRTGTEG